MITGLWILVALTLSVNLGMAIKDRNGAAILGWLCSITLASTLLLYTLNLN
jgi:hypothetical protein